MTDMILCNELCADRENPAVQTTSTAGRSRQFPVIDPAASLFLLPRRRPQQLIRRFRPHRVDHFHRSIDKDLAPFRADDSTVDDAAVPAPADGSLAWQIRVAPGQLDDEGLHGF